MISGPAPGCPTAVPCYIPSPGQRKPQLAGHVTCFGADSPSTTAPRYSPRQTAATCALHTTASAPVRPQQRRRSAPRPDSKHKQQLDRGRRSGQPPKIAGRLSEGQTHRSPEARDIRCLTLLTTSAPRATCRRVTCHLPGGARVTAGRARNRAVSTVTDMSPTWHRAF